MHGGERLCFAAAIDLVAVACKTVLLEYGRHLFGIQGRYQSAMC